MSSRSPLIIFQGRTFSSIIKDFIATYENLRDFENVYATDTGRKAYDTTLANMKKKYPYYIKEMQGVADGAKVNFTQLFLLQMDDLIGNVNDNHIPRNDTGGCSSIAFKNSQTTLLGHTEDAFHETLNHFYIMSAHIIPSPEDAKAGAYLFMISYWYPARTFITRAMLAAKNFEEAEHILLDQGLGIGNGFSVNMIWTNNWGDRQIYNIEVSPDLKADHSHLNVQKYDKEPLVHTNKYQRTNVTEVTGRIIDSSVARLRVIHSYPKPHTRKELAEILSDTSDKEFRLFQDHPDDIIMTIAAGIFDLDKRTWSIYINKPKCSEPVAVLPITFSSLDY
ncbi:hypothetical protein HF086_006535 [Spodoptera exigua]|uniref:Peptidase C45 hydrolase domain-containing protein n=1 Tax=Spodoptera exigua TaxID=7107 RepID=A0A922MKY7_SPOEX|nr:hypothetical protein HF086_006535 [Spodoptera exigua]